MNVTPNVNNRWNNNTRKLNKRKNEHTPPDKLVIGARYSVNGPHIHGLYYVERVEPFRSEFGRGIEVFLKGLPHSIEHYYKRRANGSYKYLDNGPTYLYMPPVKKTHILSNIRNRQLTGRRIRINAATNNILAKITGSPFTGEGDGEGSR